MGHDNLESYFASTVFQPLIISKLGHVHCVSKTTCECVFSVQNFIYTRIRNMLSNMNVEAMLQIALEGEMRE